jgi:hypothetical protein
MADGFIVRRGGKVTEQALAPTITETETTTSSFKFTLKNEDTSTAIIRYRIDDINDEGEIIELAGGATSSAIEITGLDAETEYIVFATANVTGKVKSNVTQLAIETDESLTNATGGTITDVTIQGVEYRVHTFNENGNFNLISNEPNNTFDFLLVGGGGGGGDGQRGGGGGAGGVLLEEEVELTSQNYSITVGEGVSTGTIGENTVAFGETALGGGIGSVGFGGDNGGNGGSGGGGRSSGGSGGSGLQPTSASGGLGNNAGSGSVSGNTALRYGGGGGGADAAGSNGTTSLGGAGGAGVFINLNGTNTEYGRGGTADDNNNVRGVGFGANSPTGYQNTNNFISGDGIVIIRYKLRDSNE